MAAGVLFGFLAAFFQSISYFCTILFIRHHKNDIGILLALSHLIIGIISVPLVWYLMPEDMPAWASYQWSLFGTTGFYLLGQVFLFMALTRTEASRVSPLLGLKIIMLAVISAVILHQPVVPTKWVAVGFATLAALLLSNSGVRMGLSSIVLVLCACLTFSISDLNIKVLVDHFRHMGVIRGALFATGLTYLLCGSAGLVFLAFRHKRVDRQTWVYSLPFALSWLIAIFCLFCCFALIGVVFGNILQSTRGLVSIGLGYLIAYLGFERLEPKITRGVFIRRVIAGILMTGAVALFFVG